MTKKLLDGEIDRLDPNVINEDLKEYFESTPLNIYAGDGWKIKRELKKLCPLVKSVRHRKNGGWSPMETIVTYVLNFNPATPEEGVFVYEWKTI